MKTTEVEEGTRFLLCTDGITRHIPDSELRQLLTSAQGAEAICGEMKERCYERGAEDNLTAVIVQVGEPKYEATFDDQRTQDLSPAAVPTTGTSLTPPSRIAFPGHGAAETSSTVIAASAKSNQGLG